MKEKLYTIPVNDAFKEDCECPLCNIYKKLEQEALEYTLRPSTYMTDDRRLESDKVGFLCATCCNVERNARPPRTCSDVEDTYGKIYERDRSKTK